MSASEHKRPLFPFSLNEAVIPQDHIFYKMPLPSFFIGFICLLVSFYLKKSHNTAFFYSFHVSWLFFATLSFGSVFFVLVQFATKAGWSVVIRRLAEHVMQTIPVLFILLSVMILGSKFIYHEWLSEASFSDKILESKRWYLNQPFFYLRSVIYFGAFWLATIIFTKWSTAQDKSGDHELTYKLQKASYPFLAFLGFCVTFASFDWIMSLLPHWYSTIFGLYFFASCYLSFLALLTILVRIAQNAAPFKKVITIEHYHDLGKLLFGHTCFWAYTVFSQYLIIWYGNIPEETIWYKMRQEGGWWWIWTFLCTAHFILPFLFLMARKVKRSPNMVVFAAAWILLVHFIDVYWLIMPNFYPEPAFQLTDLFTFLGIGGVFFGVFSFYARKHPLFPVKDPRLPESLSYENV